MSSIEGRRIFTHEEPCEISAVSFKLHFKTQYQQKWCKELIHTRGMVVDEDGQIIARPLPKFFNLSEITGWDELQEQEYELYKKIDGSLIIMFHYKGKRIFCNRGIVMKYNKNVTNRKKLQRKVASRNVSILMICT